MEETCLLVIIDSFNSLDVNINKEEMILLCQSAKVNLIDTIVYKRNFVEPNTFIGKGQLEFLSNACFEENIDYIIFSENLSPIQIRNIEKITNKRVIDRTQLILDIFSQRAQSNEGKIQVELAQLEYLLPRLTGKGIEMSRISGGRGFAARGPGETKLETNRRKIKDRIYSLKNKLNNIDRQRKISSQNRLKSNIPSVSIVGYTSAGKTTLLNTLTNEEAYADAMLFATLDPLTRKVTYNNTEFFLSDTVGFLQNLPHNIIAAFKSTLEETLNADIIIHLIDSTKDNIDDNILTVNNTLQDLNINKDTSIINVFNKIDSISQEKYQSLYYNYTDSLFISAKNNIGIDILLKKIESIILKDFKYIKLILPYNNKDLSLLYDKGKIIKQDYLENGIYFELYIHKIIYHYFQDYII